MATGKVRIYELSKVLGVGSKELMDLLEDKYSVSVKSHSSTIDQDLADKLVSELRPGKKKKEKEKPPQKEELSTEPAPKPELKPSQPPTAPPPVKDLKKTGDSEGAKNPPVVETAATGTKTGTGNRTPVPAQRESGGVRPLPPKVPVAPLSQRQQPERPPQPLPKPKAGPPSPPVSERQDPVHKKSSPLPGRRDAAASTYPSQQRSGAVVKDVKSEQPPAKKPENREFQKPSEDFSGVENDALLDILKPAAEEEPYSEIAKTVERSKKGDQSKAGFKKVPETEKGEKVIVPVSPKKESSLFQPAATATIAGPVVAEPVVIEIESPLSIAELAQKLKKRETELIRHLFMKGVMVTVNQTMPVEDAVSLAKELGFEAKGPEKKAEVDKYSAPELKIRHTKGKHLKPRAPVVSIMGHVDHGKTSLLDAIREARHKIVDSEAGGITQSIGAYTVNKDDHKIVFIDTPGHEAFTAMRMRGAQATDIAILVVAADDGVMPQTIEAINHAKAANIPIIVAINKIDKANADPEKVLVQLSEHGLSPEKWGGDTIAVEVSALQKLGLDDLLEMIALVAELQDLKADPTVPAEGIVIEARLDKGKGPVATVLVQNGTLHVGENIILNRGGGRIRALINDFGERIRSAGPSAPVEILGLSDVPQAGDSFVVILNDKEFKRLVQQRTGQERDQRRMAAPGLTSETDTERKDFYLIIKGDTRGSVEAVSSSILHLATEEVSIHILHAGTGDVSEADVLLASASNAVIIAFNVKEETNAQRFAQERGIQVRSYDVIYHVIEDMEKMMVGMLSPETEEQEIGVAEVRQLFTFGKTTIAGCYVTDGKVVRNSMSRVLRNGKEIFKGQLNNLKRFKEDAREVAAGYECGISFDKFNDIQPGDIIRLYTIKEKERTSL